MSEAYEVLGDEDRRRNYDGFGSSSSSSSDSPGQDFGGGSGFRSGRTRGGGQWAQWQYQSNVNPEDLFRQIFGEFKNFGQQTGRRQDFGFGTIFEVGLNKLSKTTYCILITKVNYSLKLI